jgi:hypothetical protein
MRCTATAKRTGEQCARSAIAGANICRVHGANGAVRAAAQRRVAEEKARQEVAKQGIVVPANQNPLDVLDETLARIVALRDRLGLVVDRLADESLRYPGRNGENIRGELTAYQGALRDTVKAAEAMLKLGIAERRVRVQEAEAMLLGQCLDRVFERLGLTDDQQSRVDRIVIEELDAIQEVADERGRSAYPGRGTPTPLLRAR